MTESDFAKRPEAIRNRADAVELWKHLLGRGISFHWEDDPADWVDENRRPALSVREAGAIRRLFREVARLDDDRCYDDAVSLYKLALLVGLDAVPGVPVRHASAFEKCGSPEEARSILKRLRLPVPQA